MDEGLLRQRRNLLITCMILWFMKYGGITFTKISFAGVDIAFKNPDALLTAIWIAFFYFLYRYYQYFSDKGVRKLGDVFTSALLVTTDPTIRNIIDKMHPHNISGYPNYVGLKQCNWIYKGTERVNPELSFSEGAYQIKISRWMLKNNIFVVFLDIVFRNSVVTDYILPFVVAIFIIWYCGNNDWHGSFLRLLF